MPRDRLHTPSLFSKSSRLMLPAASLLVWGWVAFSAVSWALRWSAIGTPPSNASAAETQVLTEMEAGVGVSAVARSLGVAPVQPVAAPTLASRFQLQGVMAGGPDAGAALLAVDGQSAKPYRVGAVVAEGWVLQSVQGRRISLGAAVDGPQTLVLELPSAN